MPYAPAPPPPMQYGDPKPGIVPLRPLGLSDVLGGAWHAIWHNPKAVLGLPALILVLASVIGTLIGLAVNTAILQWLTGFLNQGELGPALAELHLTIPELIGSVGPSAGSGFISELVKPIIIGLLAVAISQSVLGNRISTGDAWRRVAGRIGALIGWTFLSVIAAVIILTLGSLAVFGLTYVSSQLSAGFAVFIAVITTLGLLALVLWLGMRLLFVPVIIVVEKATIGQAIRRSWELSRGNFWRILGIYLLATLILIVVSIFVAMPFTAIAAGLGIGGGIVGPTVVNLISSIISSLISLVFTAGVTTLLYLDCRMRDEGLHNSLIAATNNPTQFPATL